ncbi:MAG: uroporphyrinogen decarboxylase family protein [Candidatus Latescibacterota bacterium]
MRTTMTSRERLLAAMALQETDHVPLYCLWSHDRDPFNRRDHLKRIPATLALGFDDTLWLHGPWRVAPEVTVSGWSQPQPGEDHVLLHKRFETPAGVLEHVVRSSEYLTSPEEVGVFGDLNMSHGVKSLVQGPQDLPALRYLLSDPGPEQLDAFREQARAYRRFADEQQVLLEGAYVSLGDAAAWLVRPQDLIYAQQDDPGFVEELLEIIWGWHVRQIGLLVQAGVDVILHRGWYEMPDFWGVAGYRRFLKPRLKEESAIVRQAGKRFSYIMTKGIMPLLDDFLEIDMDLLWGVDPVQGAADLEGVARRTKGRLCVLGGMNGNLTMTEGKPEQIRAAVEEAIRVLGPGGGFVLSPVDKIEAWTPWENVEALLARWRELA